MTGRPVQPGVLAVSLIVLLGACSITGTRPEPAGPPASGLRPSEAGPAPAVHLYFHSAQGLERVSRLHRGPDPVRAALQDLVEGPTTAERARGLTSAVPGDAPVPVVTAEEGGTVEILLPPGWEAGRAAERQLVCTAADNTRTTKGPAGLEGIRVTVHRTSDDGAVAQSCTR